ncbi:hypothetical protein LJK87_21950 [Paenibacillus sp. P25]|nr:hypothetical protein LJK87_21950 [Paenibacillus sp. P25]
MMSSNLFKIPKSGSRIVSHIREMTTTEITQGMKKIVRKIFSALPPSRSSMMANRMQIGCCRMIYPAPRSRALSSDFQKRGSWNNRFLKFSRPTICTAVPGPSVSVKE